MSGGLVQAFADKNQVRQCWRLLLAGDADFQDTRTLASYGALYRLGGGHTTPVAQR